MSLDKSHLYLVVIAGGSGTRFWPKSTSKRPKQLLSFGGAKSGTLLAQTISRFDGLVPAEQRVIVTTRVLGEAIEREKTGAVILAEPQARNTAPCIYWAAQYVLKKDPQALMLVMPSDHYIANADQFVATMKEAIQWATEKEDLVTLGIRPSRPETGYGYLKMSPGKTNRGAATKVESFVEKPNLEKAKEFLKNGNYLWNGGIFLWRASVILKAFDRYMPEMSQAWKNANGEVDGAYPSMTATSIDYGIMEKASNVVTFPLDCGWDDLGSWTSLESLADSLKSRQGENVVTDGELLSLHSSGNIVDAPGRLVTLLGVRDLIIVQQGETLLVAHKDRAQEMKQVVEEVKKRRPELV